MSLVTTNGSPVLKFTSDTDMNVIVVGNFILVDNISHFNDWAEILSVDPANFTATVDQAMMSTQKSTFQISTTDPNATGSGSGGGGTSTNVIKRVTPYIGLSGNLGNFSPGAPPSQAAHSHKFCDDFTVDLVAGKVYEFEIPVYIRTTGSYTGPYILLIDKNDPNAYTNFRYSYQNERFGLTNPRDVFYIAKIRLNATTTETKTFEVRIAGSIGTYTIYINSTNMFNDSLEVPQIIVREY